MSDQLRQCREAIERLNPVFNAMVHVLTATPPGASGPLRGRVFAVKDNIEVAGAPTTFGSRLFADHRSTTTASSIARLRDAGALVVGKCNLGEFAFGATTLNRFLGACRNAWDPERVAGGSSGGSAVAVATGMCDIAIGTDTGGSIRLPAAFAGVVGHRPTPGVVPVDGVMPRSALFDTVGPMARRVEDVAAAHRAMAAAPAVAAGEWADGLRGLRIGVLEQGFLDQAEPGIAAAVADAVDVLGRIGAASTSVRLPDVERAREAMHTICDVDSARVHALRLREQATELDPAVVQRLERGTRTPEPVYEAALRWRGHWSARLVELLRDVDVLLCPTAPAPPPMIDDAREPAQAGQLARLSDFTRPWAFAGVPALTVPCGFDELGLPVGLQLVAAAGEDELLFCVGQAYQAATHWHEAEPDLTAVASVAGRSGEAS